MKRILVIDDDEQIRLLFEVKLKEEGYLVDVAGEGQTGIKMFKAAPYDLVITDLVMPKKEGLETIHELLHIAPQTKIIAISGGGKLVPGSFLSVANKLGALATFEKPINWAELLKTIKITVS